MGASPLLPTAASLEDRRRALAAMGLGQLVPTDKVLPGREQPMPVSSKHYVLGNPMRGPWPEGFQVCVFANGCFWGSEKASTLAVLVRRFA